VVFERGGGGGKALPVIFQKRIRKVKIAHIDPAFWKGGGEREKRGK